MDAGRFKIPPSLDGGVGSPQATRRGELAHRQGSHPEATAPTIGYGSQCQVDA